MRTVNSLKVVNNSYVPPSPQVFLKKLSHSSAKHMKKSKDIQFINQKRKNLGTDSVDIALEALSSQTSFHKTFLLH